MRPGLQQANFAEVNTKLDDLRKLSSDPDVQRALGDLAGLLEQQGALAEQTEQQLQLMAEELAASKDRELAERGVAVINLSGTGRRMNVGDVIDFMAGDRACKVFFKQATPREDGRVGFDLDCG
jgi:hypothetical protein